MASKLRFNFFLTPDPVLFHHQDGWMVFVQRDEAGMNGYVRLD